MTNFYTQEQTRLEEKAAEIAVETPYKAEPKQAWVYVYDDNNNIVHVNQGRLMTNGTDFACEIDMHLVQLTEQDLANAIR